jgi:hypothetical protein
MFVLAWLLVGLCTVLWVRQKHPMAPWWLILFGLVTTVTYLIVELMPEKQSLEEQLTEDEREIRRLTEMTEALKRNRPDGQAIGRIQRTTRPDLVIEDIYGHERQILQRASEGYFHYFIVDTSVGSGNKVIATSVKAFVDLSQGSYASREVAEQLGLQHLNSIMSDPEHNAYEDTDHNTTLEVRTVASGSMKLKMWVDKLKDQKFPI